MLRGFPIKIAIKPQIWILLSQEDIQNALYALRSKNADLFGIFYLILE